jgi:hypothetical protein
VETIETPFDHAVYGVALEVALCEYRGKQGSQRPGGERIQEALHALPHIFRTLRKPSPQAPGHQVNARKKRENRDLAVLGKEKF